MDHYTFADDWVKIIGAAASAISAICGAIILVINASQNRRITGVETKVENSAVVSQDNSNKLDRVQQSLDTAAH